MKKLSTIALLLFTFIMLASLSSCGEADTSGVPDGMKEASTNAATFHMFVPESWIVDIQTGSVRAHASNSDPSNVSVMAWGLNKDVKTVDDWWNFNLQEMNGVFPGADEAEIENSTLGGIAAKKYIFDSEFGGQKYKFMQIAAVKDNSVYVLTYTAADDKFDSNLEDAMSIAKELKYK